MSNKFIFISVSSKEWTFTALAKAAPEQRWNNEIINEGVYVNEKSNK